MIGRKHILTFLVLVSIVSSTFSFVFPRTASAAVVDNAKASLATCDKSFSQFGPKIKDFALDLFITRLELKAINFFTSGAEKLPVVGGAVEPIDDLVDTLVNWWNQAAWWGIIATLTSFIVGKLILAAFALNLTIGKVGFVNYGYGVILGIANIGIVLALVLTAFGTMLRWESLSAKNTLSKIITAALLINFTMFFALAVVNIGNNLTAAFIYSGQPCIGNLVNEVNVVEKYDLIKTELEKSVGLSSLNVDKEAEDERKKLEGNSKKEGDKDQNFLEKLISGVQGFFNKVVSVVSDVVHDPVGKALELVEKIIGHFFISYFSLIFASLLTVIMAATNLVLLSFLIIRYIVINLLLIVAPIIWLGYIFPNVSIPGVGNPWSGWWNNIIKWSLFGPLIVFFMTVADRYLTYYSTKTDGDIYLKIAEIIILILFSLMGIYAANKMGALGSEYVMKGTSFVVNRANEASQKFWRSRQLKAEQRAEMYKKMGEIQKAKQEEKKAERLKLITKQLDLPSTAAGTLLAGAGLIIPESKPPKKLSEAEQKRFEKEESLFKRKRLLTPSVIKSLKSGERQNTYREVDRLVKLVDAGNLKNAFDLKAILSEKPDKESKLTQEQHGVLRDAFLKAVFTTSSALVGELFKALNRKQKIAFKEESQRIISDLFKEGRLTDEIKRWWNTNGGQRMFSLYTVKETKPKEKQKENKKV